LLARELLVREVRPTHHHASWNLLMELARTFKRSTHTHTSRPE
jgi:hypothetical protein